MENDSYRTLSKYYQELEDIYWAIIHGSADREPELNSRAAKAKATATN